MSRNGYFCHYLSIFQKINNIARRETIVFLEKGKYIPSLNLAHQVAKALQTTIDDLFDFED